LQILIDWFVEFAFHSRWIFSWYF